MKYMLLMSVARRRAIDRLRPGAARRAMSSG
jgi:hypothetical protein